MQGSDNFTIITFMQDSDINNYIYTRNSVQVTHTTHIKFTHNFAWHWPEQAFGYYDFLYRTMLCIDFSCMYSYNFTNVVSMDVE